MKFAPNPNDRREIKAMTLDGRSPEEISNKLRIKLGSVETWAKHFLEESKEQEKAAAAAKTEAEKKAEEAKAKAEEEYRAKVEAEIMEKLKKEGKLKPAPAVKK